MKSMLVTRGNHWRSSAQFGRRRLAARVACRAVIVILAGLGILTYAVPLRAQIVASAQLNVERRGHTATLLDDGKVLIVGGDNQSGMISQAEIFDPASQSVSLSAASIAARTDHTATKLPDGRVIVIGGQGQTGSLTSTEIFNPVTASFTAGPSLTTPRSGHTATVLADGKILVAGGDASGSAEIYDPLTQNFSLVTGNMQTARKFHSAILTSSGQVLIVGGVDAQNSILNTAEVYDPSSQSFYTPPTDMQAPRALATLKLLADGKVQIIGGDAELSIEVFDPSDGIFIAKALLPPNADLLVATLSTQSRAALFSPSISQDPLLQGVLNSEQRALLDRSDHSITELPSRNQALVAGGINSGGQILNSAKLVNSSKATVTTDKTDYAPGQIVTISGRGFQANEQVDIYFHEFPEEYPDVYLSATANQQGNFLTAEFAPKEIDLGRIFTLTAIGRSSGFSAQTAFKDDKRVTIAFAGTGSGTVTSASVPTQPTQLNCISTGGSASGTCQVNFDNHATLTLTGVPSSGSSIGGWNVPTGYSINSGCGSGNTTCNFTMNNTAQTVTVTFNSAAATTTTVASSANPSTYGQSVTFTATVSRTSGSGAPAGTVQFKINGVTLGTPVTLTSVNATTANATSAGTTTLPVGTHVVTAEYAPAAGFNASSGTLVSGQVVNKLTIVVTPTAGQNKTYGSAEPTLSYGFAPALIGSDTFSGALARDPGEDAGLYNILQGTLALSSNYTLSFTSGVKFEIKKLTIVVTPTAGQNKTYGSAEPTLSYGFAPALIGSDTFSGALARDPGEDAGLYNILQGTLALSSNYTLSFTSGVKFEIKKRPVTIAADSNTKVYGQPDPALTYQITSGSLKSGDTITGALTRAAGENVGTYAISQGTLAISDGNGGNNYDLTFVGALLTINRRPITISAEAKSKFYGDADPALTYQITSGSLKSGDTITGALTRAAGENVGTYAISQGTLAISDGNGGNNYDLTFVGALFSINKRPITITADAKSKIYGESDPPLTYQITSGSLAFSDTFGGALSRDPGELVGTYAIKQGSLALNSNYSLTFIGSNLTVTTAFAFNGFYSPIGGSVETGNGGSYSDPVRSFKLGSTIPVKFGANWLNGGGTLTTGIHTLSAAKYSNATVHDDAIDATPTDAASIGNQFRLSGTEWHFNLSTKNGITAGTWLLIATLEDGSKHTVWIAIKK